MSLECENIWQDLKSYYHQINSTPKILSGAVDLCTIPEFGYFANEKSFNIINFKMVLNLQLNFLHSIYYVYTKDIKFYVNNELVKKLKL